MMQRRRGIYHELGHLTLDGDASIWPEILLRLNYTNSKDNQM